MSHFSESQYYAKRAAEHGLAGNEAVDPSVVMTHRNFAKTYETKRVAELSLIAQKSSS